MTAWPADGQNTIPAEEGPVDINGLGWGLAFLASAKTGEIRLVRSFYLIRTGLAQIHSLVGLAVPIVGLDEARDWRTGVATGC